MAHRRHEKAVLLQEQIEEIAAVRLQRMDMQKGDTHVDPMPGENNAPEHSIVGVILQAASSPRDTTTTEPSPVLATITTARPREMGNALQRPLSSTQTSTPTVTGRGIELERGIERGAPRASSLTSAFKQALYQQHALVSTACLSFFIDHLRLYSHLHMVRQVFFMEAGDWVDEFLRPLEHRVSIEFQPLTLSVMKNILSDSLQASSLANAGTLGTNKASMMSIELVSGSTALSKFLQYISLLSASPLSLPRTKASAPVLVSPTALDGLDCILLRFNHAWPLPAVLTEDTAVGYAAVFSAMLRVRRVSVGLKRIWKNHLLHSARQQAASLQLPLSPKVQGRLQKLRVFVQQALLFVAAISAFQGETTQGKRWEDLKGSTQPSSTRLEKENGYEENGGWRGGGGGERKKTLDLPRILELHRQYALGTANDCLTYCGKENVARAVDEVLGVVVEATALIESAVDVGASVSVTTNIVWERVLGEDARWGPIERRIGDVKKGVGWVCRCLDECPDGQTRRRRGGALGALAARVSMLCN